MSCLTSTTSGTKEDGNHWKQSLYYKGGLFKNVLAHFLKNIVSGLYVGRQCLAEESLLLAVNIVLQTDSHTLSFNKDK
jgi:hypothetical protein